MYVCVSKWSKWSKYIYLTCIAVVRTVAIGHKMVGKGWELFEEVVKDAGAGDLPQLLRSIHTMTTPPPATPPLAPMDLTAMTPLPLPSPIKEEGKIPREDPILMRVGGRASIVAPSVTKSQSLNMGVTLTLSKCTQGKPLCVPIAGSPLIT